MGFKEWKYGLHKLTQKEINNLKFPKGLLLQIVPSHSSLDSINEMQHILYMLQQYPSRYTFEIWKDDKITLRFYCSSPSVEGMLKAQLNSVYPNVIVKRSKTSIPELKPGEYVSTGTIVLQGLELNLKQPDNYRFDPLRHILEAINIHECKIIVQVLFERLNKIPKDKKIILQQKYGDELFYQDFKIPILRCMIRIATISKEGYKTRESCMHITRTFSIFDSDKANMVPKIVTYPVIRNSYDVFSNIVKRRFPVFSKSFMASVPELTSMVHLPVGAENTGVEYSKPSIAPSNLPW